MDDEDGVGGGVFVSVAAVVVVGVFGDLLYDEEFHCTSRYFSCFCCCIYVSLFLLFSLLAYFSLVNFVSLASRDSCNVASCCTHTDARTHTLNTAFAHS